MHHPRAEDFDPSRSFACGTAAPTADAALDIHLGRWLGEREKRRTKARFDAAKEAHRELIERGLEVDEADPLVDGQTFDLHERRRVRRVEEVATIRVARNQHA